MNKHILWIKAKCLDYYKFIASLNKIRVKILEIK